MKQKVVIKVASMNNQKLRSKALKIAVGCSGVESAALKGDEKDQLEATGEGLDAAVLTNLLRKNVGHAMIVSVGPVEEKKEKKEETISNQEKWTYCFEEGFPCYPIYEYRIINECQDPSCSIM